MAPVIDEIFHEGPVDIVCQDLDAQLLGEFLNARKKIFEFAVLFLFIVATACKARSHNQVLYCLSHFEHLKVAVQSRVSNLGFPRHEKIEV